LRACWLPKIKPGRGWHGSCNESPSEVKNRE